MLLEPTVGARPEGEGVWVHYTMRDGLPDMKIECIFEDSRGLLWIGTHDRGVARFDGTGFTCLDRRDGLASNGIYAVVEDADGCLWFSTSRGLSRYDGKHFETLALEGASSFLWGSCRDLQGRLWFGLERWPGRPAALCCWDGSSLRLVQLTDSVSDLGESIHKVVCDAQGRIWAGGGRLYCGDGETFGCPEAAAALTATVLDVVGWPDGRLWVATEAGIWSVSAEEASLVFLEPGRHKPTSCVLGEKGTCWAVTHDGRVLHFDGPHVDEVKDLATTSRSGLCRDAAGRVWIGTYGMGLFRYDTTRVRVYRREHGLPHNAVECLAVAGSDRLWVGTRAGLACIDRGSLSPVDAGADVEYGGVSAMVVDRRQRLWMGTQRGKLCVRDDEGARVEALVEQFSWYRIGQLAEDKQGRIWFGAPLGQGFGYWQDGRVTMFPAGPKAEYPCWVGALAPTPDGGLWIGSANPLHWDGLCYFDGQRFQRVRSVAGSAVLALHLSPGGCLWVGTSEGLVRVEGEKTTTFTQRDGMSCDIVTALAEDAQGTLWIGTEGGGVCRYDGSVFQSIEIPGDAAHGVVHSLAIDAEGAAWLGTEGGLIRYRSSDCRPEVEVVSLVADKEYRRPRRVQLPSDVNRIRVRVRGASLDDMASSLVYRFRLHGHETTWRAQRGDEVEYAGLAPGRYTLAVQAVSGDLNYSEVAEVRVSIPEDAWIALLSEGTDLPEGRRPGAGEEILLADPDVAFARTCARFLERAGYRVHLAVDEERATQAAEAQGFDVVLVDISLAHSASLLMRCIRARAAGPDAIIMATYDDLHERRRARAAALPSEVYLPKPFEPRQILARLADLLAIRREPITAYIREHVAEIDSREQVASLFRTSPGTVRNRVRKASRMSFTRYLQACRVEEAHRLLVYTELNVQQIAGRVGLTHSALTRMFKRVTGRSPLEHRRRSRLPP